MCCQTKCDGSKLRPKLGLGMSSNIRRQMAGLVARFLPPGHSSLREEHRAVLDADPHLVLLGVRHQRPPRLEEARPVLVHRLRPVAADEGVDLAHAQQLRRPDDLLQVIDVDLRLGRVGGQRVRVVAEAADRDAVLVEQPAHRGRRRARRASRRPRASRRRSAARPCPSASTSARRSRSPRRRRRPAPPRARGRAGWRRRIRASSLHLRAPSPSRPCGGSRGSLRTAPPRGGRPGTWRNGGGAEKSPFAM